MYIKRSFTVAIMESFTWAPLDLKKRCKFNLGSYALIILNRPIVLPPDEMMTLWREATLRSTVDGGTTRWFEFLKQHKLDVTYPDIVSGDFDSISPSLLKTCEEHGVYVERTVDQNYTDFEKALHVIKQQCDKKLDTLLVLLDVSCRLDHTFANLNTLYRVKDIFPDQDIKAFLLTSVSLTWILNPGHHTISIPSYLRDEQEWCGILPFTPVKNHVTTTGLKWNLDNLTIEFGGLISSSNTYDGSPEVTLTTDFEIIWCMGYRQED
uniref:Thiamin pyrophosphokinase 1 n=2 Tax=Triatoma infestans TaxID=30076 RepID=A0A170Y7E9_TRIIF